MRRRFRWVFRLALGLVILALVCGVAVLLLRDVIVKEILIRRLRAATGMEARIEVVHVGLFSPTVSIEGLKLYNTADFGGAVCLDMPELRVEYDRSALRARQLHLTLLRLDLEELSVVQDKQGRKNFDAAQKKNKESRKRPPAPEQWEFIGIDVLNASLGKFRVTNLASGRGEEIDFGVKNQMLRHVKDWADLAPLGLTTLSHGKASVLGDADVDLGQWLDSLLKTP